MTAQAVSDLPETLHAISALHHRAAMLNAMADAADVLFDEMPDMAPSRYSNGLSAVLVAIVEQSQSLANDLDKLWGVFGATAKGVQHDSHQLPLRGPGTGNARL